MKRIYGYVMSLLAISFSGIAVADIIAPTSFIVYQAVEVEVAEAETLEIATTTATSTRVKALEDYLTKKGAPELAMRAEEIMTLPRWQESLAIIAKETTFCQYGVGSSRNNCGAIRSPIPGRGFKIYETKFDSVWDVSYLLTKPRYANKTIAEMNGIYCYQADGVNGECDNWDEHINMFLAEIRTAIDLND